MKIRNIVAWAVCSLVGFSACNNDDNFSNLSEDNPLAVKFNVSIATTRTNPSTDNTNEDVFSENDVITVVSGKQTATYTFGPQGWTPSNYNEQILWESTEQSFQANYPAGDFSMGFSIPTDQSEPAKIAMADYMTYCGTHQRNVYGKITFAMQRQTARVDVNNIQFNTEFEGIHPKVIAIEMYSLSKIGGIDNNFVPVKALKTEKGFTALVAPVAQTPEQRFMKITISTDVEPNNVLYVNHIPALEAGKKHEFSLNIGKNRVELQTISIKPWVNEVDSDIKLPIEEINNIVDSLTHSITLWTSGTLTEAMIVKALNGGDKVSIGGYVGGADMMVIRKAAGSTNWLYDNSGNAIIKNLDLSKAHIIGDGTIYSSEYSRVETKSNQITEGMFMNCKLTSIKLPNNITHIGKWAFFNSELNTTLVLPDSLTEIGIKAFENSRNLPSFQFSKSGKLTQIKYEAFKDCRGITELLIPEGVTYLEQIFDINILYNKVSFPSTLRNLDICKIETHKLYILFTNENAEGIKDIIVFDSNINTDLYLHESWRNDVQGTTWRGMAFKSITFINSQGEPV